MKDANLCRSTGTRLLVRPTHRRSVPVTTMSVSWLPQTEPTRRFDQSGTVVSGRNGLPFSQVRVQLNGRNPGTRRKPRGSPLKGRHHTIRRTWAAAAFPSVIGGRNRISLSPISARSRRLVPAPGSARGERGTLAPVRAGAPRLCRMSGFWKITPLEGRGWRHAILRGRADGSPPALVERCGVVDDPRYAHRSRLPKRTSHRTDRRQRFPWGHTQFFPRRALTS